MLKKLVVVILALAFAMPVLAEELKGSFGGLYGGYRIFDGERDYERNTAEWGVFGGHFFQNNYAVDFHIGALNTKDENGSKEDFATMGLGGSKNFEIPVENLYPYVGLGLVHDKLTGPYAKAGLKYIINEYVLLDLGVREDILGSGINDTTFIAGVAMRFGAKSEPVRLDTDGDGVFDDLDQCPGTPKGVSVDLKGCPLDTDGDGVYDYLDKCADTPAGVAVNADGCPLDSDKDGVLDYLDKCPDTPAGVEVDKDGCPLDVDGDMVYDYKDSCLGTPNGAMVNESGCLTPVILEIKFDTGKSIIKGNYFAEIAAFADYLKILGDKKFEIQGHTDNVGLASKNKKLSQKRADALKKYLVEKHEISADRITAVGYGEEKPLADNSTKEGRAENRRLQISFE